MVIIGIDPGSVIVGFGIIEINQNIFNVLNYGCINIKDDFKSKSLFKIRIEIIKLLEKYKPDVAVVESLFFFKNAKTIISVSQARGVILSVFQEKNIKVLEFTPLQIKQAVCGYGKADKNQVKKMVNLILNIKKVIKPDDATDALAAAICASNFNY